MTRAPRRAAAPTPAPAAFTGVAEGRGRSIDQASALAIARATVQSGFPVPQHIRDVLGAGFDEAALLADVEADQPAAPAEPEDSNLSTGEPPADDIEA